MLSTSSKMPSRRNSSRFTVSTVSAACSTNGSTRFKAGAICSFTSSTKTFTFSTVSFAFFTAVLTRTKTTMSATMATMPSTTSTAAAKGHMPPKASPIPSMMDCPRSSSTFRRQTHMVPENSVLWQRAAQSTTPNAHQSALPSAHPPGKTRVKRADPASPHVSPTRRRALACVSSQACAHIRNCARIYANIDFGRCFGEPHAPPRGHLAQKGTSGNTQSPFLRFSAPRGERVPAAHGDMSAENT